MQFGYETSFSLKHFFNPKIHKILKSFSFLTIPDLAPCLLYKTLQHGGIYDFKSTAFEKIDSNCWPSQKAKTKLKMELEFDFNLRSAGARISIYYLSSNTKKWLSWMAFNCNWFTFSNPKPSDDCSA